MPSVFTPLSHGIPRHPAVLLSKLRPNPIPFPGTPVHRSSDGLPSQPHMQALAMSCPGPFPTRHLSGIAVGLALRLTKRERGAFPPPFRPFLLFPQALLERSVPSHRRPATFPLRPTPAPAPARLGPSPTARLAGPDPAPPHSSRFLSSAAIFSSPVTSPPFPAIPFPFPFSFWVLPDRIRSFVGQLP
jgi:hypothetical protein